MWCYEEKVLPKKVTLGFLSSQRFGHTAQEEDVLDVEKIMDNNHMGEISVWG